MWLWRRVIEFVMEDVGGVAVGGGRGVGGLMFTSSYVPHLTSGRASFQGIIQTVLD